LYCIVPAIASRAEGQVLFSISVLSSWISLKRDVTLKPCYNSLDITFKLHCINPSFACSPMASALPRIAAGPYRPVLQRASPYIAMVLFTYSPVSNTSRIVLQMACTNITWLWHNSCPCLHVFLALLVFIAEGKSKVLRYSTVGLSLSSITVCQTIYFIGLAYTALSLKKLCAILKGTVS
jgi:hypothetical protein